MSSEMSVRAISTVQPPTQDAVSNRGQAQAPVANIAALHVTAANESMKGKSLPKTGSEMPVAPSQAWMEGKKPLSTEDVLEAVQDLNDFAQKTRRELNFSVDEQTGRTVVKVIDHETKNVIRQIPAEEILEVARRVAEQNEAKGNLFKVEV